LKSDGDIPAGLRNTQVDAEISPSLFKWFGLLLLSERLMLSL